MRTTPVFIAGLAAAMLATISASTQQTVSPENTGLPEMPKQTTRTGKRVNRVIDMWLKGQPVYYSQVSGGGYDQGRELAATKADYITYEMEHGPLDFKELREFMRGLLEASQGRRRQDPSRHERRVLLGNEHCRGTAESVAIVHV